MYDDLSLGVRAELGLPLHIAHAPLSSSLGVPPTDAAWAAEQLKAAGLSAGGFLLAHGLPSTSAYAMGASDAPDASYPAESWAVLIHAASKPVVLAVPRAADAAAVLAAVPEGKAKVIVAYTPGQLAALVAASSRVLAANTAALPIATALGKPVLALLDAKTVLNGYLAQASPDVQVVLSGSGASPQQLEALKA